MSSLWKPGMREFLASVLTVVCPGVDREGRVSMGHQARQTGEDRKSVVSGQSVSVRVDIGGSRIIKHTKQTYHTVVCTSSRKQACATIYVQSYNEITICKK